MPALLQTPPEHADPATRLPVTLHVGVPPGQVIVPVRHAVDGVHVAPDTQLEPHANDEPPDGTHNGVPPLQTVAQPPQCAGSDRSASQPLDGMVSQSAKPVVHVNEHAPEAQVALAFGGEGHGVQLPPQLFTDALLTHCPEQLWKPALHTMPHAPAAHAGAPFEGIGHACPQVPQLSVSVSVSTHTSPHCVGVEPLQVDVQL